MIIFINLKANSKRSDYCANRSVVSVVYSKFYSIEVNILQKKYKNTNEQNEKANYMQLYANLWNKEKTIKERTNFL